MNAHTCNRRDLFRLAAGAGLAAGIGTVALGTSACSSAEPTGAAPSSRAAAARGDGAAIFDLVTRYARPVHHRTGTPEAATTLNLIESELKARGARTARWGFSVPTFEWDASVRVNGREVPTIPLYFEAAGEVTTEHPFVRPATQPNANSLAALEKVVGEARAARAELAVIPTLGMFPAFPGVASPLLPYGPYPALIATNVPAVPAPASGVHTLLVSGEYADELKSGAVTAHSRSSIGSGRSENITAWFGPQTDRPFIITTPLTGWFHCAGERGTGIAIALDLAAELAAAGHSVFVLATTGHEFEDYGVARYLEQNRVTPQAVLHIGASVAAGFTDPKTRALTLGPRTWKASVATPAIGAALATANFAAYPTWVGEGRKWSAVLPADVPLLSVAGSTPLFHTPGDVPDAATNPQLLTTVYRALRDAAFAMV